MGSEWKQGEWIPPPTPEDVPLEFCMIENGKPMDYFQHFIPNGMFRTLAIGTNLNNPSIKTTTAEMMRFIGINFYIATTGCPRIRRIWEGKFRVPAVADTMPRDRFFQLRTNLRAVDYSSLSDEEKKSDPFWRVRPLYDAFRDILMELPRPKVLCVDEQIIPFLSLIHI